jgi:hypothetical protein
VSGDPGHVATVEIRAFRGSRRSSVYRRHALTTRAFARVRAATATRGLSFFSSLDPESDAELSKADARRLANEMTELRRSATLPDLDLELTAVTEVLRWCAHARGRSWLTIRGVHERPIPG